MKYHIFIYSGFIFVVFMIASVQKMSPPTETDMLSPKEFSHRIDQTKDYWQDMKVSHEARQKLQKVGQKVSDWLDIVTEANPELYPDDDEHGIYPRLGQQKSGFHEHDVLTHITASEEALRSGESVKTIDGDGLISLKETLNSKIEESSLTRYELTLVAVRLHDMGKLFEPRRLFDPERPWEKPQKGDKKSGAGIRFAG